MVDFLTQNRLHGYRYNAPPDKQGAPSYRDLYRDHTPHLFKTPRVQVHDCREDVIKDHTDQHMWEAFLFSEGLNKTYDEVTGMHSKPRDENKDGVRKPDKLLYNVGSRGKANGDFQFPRGMDVTPNGDVIIADSRNHRVQRFNQCAVYKSQWGSKGKGEGQFNEPTAVAVMPNLDIAITDRRNKRVQIFTDAGKFKYQFETVDEPYSIVCDEQYNLILSTYSSTVEVYRRQGRFYTRFQVGDSEKMGPVHLAVNDKREILVSDADSCQVKYYTYEGKFLYQFQPTSNGDGLACCPGGLCVNPIGQVLVADSLNHTINLYSERGILLQQLVGPTDDAGAVQTVRVGPEGHLVATEFTVNGVHCLKVFRYRDCDCHRTRPGSSKRQTPASANNRLILD